MKITGISVYRTDLPYVSGSYGEGGNTAITTVFAVVDGGKLLAFVVPELGEEPGFKNLGSAVATFGEVK